MRILPNLQILKPLGELGMFWVVAHTPDLACLPFSKQDETFHSGLKPHVSAGHMGSTRSPGQQMKLISGLR